VPYPPALMPPILIEWLNLLLRWTHVIAGIMWIGDSFLFMWMDSSLEPPSRAREGAVAGELWMVHSGGFYEVVKRRYLAPGELPRKLHWFKWEAYTTFLSGFLLLGVVYYLGAGAYLVDPAVARLGTAAAIAISLGALAGAWLVYDALWSSPLGRRPVVAGWISIALLVGLVLGLTRLFSGRAAYLLAGAVLGTLMVANVWRRIIPAQSQMLAATRAGTTVDLSLGAAAKMRSLHNHYLTLPVVFTMLSNHFPSTYAHPLNGLVLVLIMIFGVAVKHVMNFRGRSHRGLVAAGIAALVAVLALTMRASPSPVASGSFANAPRVSFAEAQAIIQRRCLNCHATHPANPSFPQPPSGIILEDPRRIQSLSGRIMVRAVVTKTMPLGNLTGITEDERRTLGAWIAQGASLK